MSCSTAGIAVLRMVRSGLLEDLPVTVMLWCQCHLATMHFQHARDHPCRVPTVCCNMLPHVAQFVEPLVESRVQWGSAL